MIVTARPRGEGEDRESDGEMDEMKGAEQGKTAPPATLTNGGSPTLSRTLSARERRRNIEIVQVKAGVKLARQYR